jgi:chorismate dehydratase
MGEEWMKFTGLPFVYAAWVANKKISQTFVDDFHAALKLGLAHKQQVIADLPKIPNFDLEDYFFTKLNYDLTDDKRKALNLFLSYIEKLK